MTMTIIARGAYVAEQPTLIGEESRLLVVIDFKVVRNPNTQEVMDLMLHSQKAEV